MKNNPNTQSSILIDALHSDFKKAYASMSMKNWQKQLISFFDRINFFSGNSADERMVAGWVAGLCENAYYVAAHGRTTKTRLNFEYQLNEIISSVSLPRFLTCLGPVLCGKRQPSFVGCVLPTLERFQVMERLSQVFCGTVDSIIIGGSMSYTPFFGIRENQKDKDFSDIDTLIVINNSFFKKTSWNKFMKDSLFPETEKQNFFNRIKIFQKLIHTNAADIFSQRFSVCGKPFTVSIHFVTLSVFRRMVYTDLKKSLQSKSDMEYIMRDFRVDPFRHPCHARHTFDGGRIETVIDGCEVNPSGFISSVPGYIISKGKFYPGIYHTVISTAFLVFYDCTGETRKLVKKFENILYREVKHVQKEFPSATYAKAHNRYDIFPPGRFEKGHNSYISAEENRRYLPRSCFNIVGVESSILQGEVIRSEKSHLKKNEHVRDKARNLLENWKNETLKKAEVEIKDFIYLSNFKVAISLAKKRGHQWYSVTIIPSTRTTIVKLPYPYKQVNLKDFVVREEVCIQIITPWELMRLEAYEKLARRFSKVYVASIMDSADESKCLPMSYALVIPVL